MTTRAKPGEGQIEPLPSGAFRVRLTVAGKRKTIATCDTRDEAEQVLAAARDAVASGEVTVTGGVTLASFGARVLDERELRTKGRGMAPLRGAWKHVLRAPFANRHMRSIERQEIRSWILGLGTARSLSDNTVRLVLATLRGVLREAVEGGKLAANPATEIRLPRAPVTEEPWTYLTPEEQKAITTDARIPRHDQLAIAFAIGTGLRSNEQWALELKDVHADGPRPRVVVRYGGRNHAPTKGGKIRTVPLFGLALDATREWLAMLPTFAPRNPRGLLWPGPTGERRDHSHPLGRAQVAKKKICRWHTCYVPQVLGREVRWHDLRHTFGTSLVNGWWEIGRFDLPEVRDLMGHSAVKQTERYAHIDGGTTAARVEAHIAKTTEAHAREKAMKQGDSDADSARARWTGLAVVSGGSVDSWPTRGLDALAEAVQRAIVSDDPAAPVLWAALAAQVRAAVEAVHPLLSIVRRVETLGEHGEDAAAELAAAVTVARVARGKDGSKDA